MFYSQLDNPNKNRIASMYGHVTPSFSKAEQDLINQAYDGIDGLTKADELGILSFDGINDIEKGRHAMPIGAHATWGGVSYLKTASGWKPVGKLRGNVKANHDHIHNNEDKDKDHHTMTMDAGKMDEATWTAKHGAGLHTKYKEVHDYLHKEKQTKNSGDPEAGKEYDHYAFGKVKVKAVHKDDGDNRKRMTIEFTTSNGKTELQGIDGFNTSLAEHKKAGKTFHDEQMEKFDKEKKVNQNADIPEKVIEKFKEVSTDTNFSFINVKGRMWRRDNKDGKITDHAAAPSFKLPGGDEKSESDVLDKLTNTERSFYKNAKERTPNLDLNNINTLADKIAALGGGERKVEHFAEALMYDHAQKDISDDSKYFGKIDPSDIMTGLKNPNYSFPNLERLDEVGILSKETKDEMKQASKLFEKVGSLDKQSKTLINIFQTRILEDKPASEQLAILSSVVDNAEQFHEIDQKFNSGKKSEYAVHVAQAISNEINKIDGTTGIDHDKSAKLVESGLAEYKKAPAVRKAKMKKQIEDNIKMHEHGIKHIGLGMDETVVHAGREFLKKIA